MVENRINVVVVGTLFALCVLNIVDAFVRHRDIELYEIIKFITLNYYPSSRVVESFDLWDVKKAQRSRQKTMSAFLLFSFSYFSRRDYTQNTVAIFSTQCIGIEIFSISADNRLSVSQVRTMLTVKNNRISMQKNRE